METRETRTIALSLRAAQSNTGEFRLEGRAASYNVLSNPISSASGIAFRERLDPGVFARSLAQIARGEHDCIATFNHDESRILGRVSAGTLKLQDSPSGLDFAVQLDPTNTDHRNLYASVKRQDISECSFAFTVDREAGGDTFDTERDPDTGGSTAVRTIHAARLFDVSAVTNPAYPTGTAVSARSRRGADYCATQREAALTFAGRILRPDVDAENRKRAAAIAQQIASDIYNRNLENKKLHTKAREVGEQIHYQELMDPSLRAVKAIFENGRCVRFERDYDEEKRMEEQDAELLRFNETRSGRLSL